MGYQEFKLALHLKQDADFCIHFSEPLAAK